MADHTSYPNGDPIVRSGGANAASMPAFTVFENTFEAARLTVAIGESFEILKIPANSYVLGVTVDVQAAEAAVTLDVGDAGDPNGYVAAADCSAVATVKGAGAYLDNVGALPTPQFYATETTLECVVAGANASAMQVRVAVAVLNMG